jgi:hypothetical protein
VVEAVCPGHRHAQGLHDVQNHAFDGYCPAHEFDWTECCNCCIERRAELRRIDRDLRNYWGYWKYSFRDRGRF